MTGRSETGRVLRSRPSLQARCDRGGARRGARSHAVTAMEPDPCHHRQVPEARRRAAPRSRQSVRRRKAGPTDPCHSRCRREASPEAKSGHRRNAVAAWRSNHLRTECPTVLPNIARSKKSVASFTKRTSGLNPHNSIPAGAKSMCRGVYPTGQGKFSRNLGSQGLPTSSSRETRRVSASQGN